MKPNSLSPAETLLFRAISKTKVSDLEKAFKAGAKVNVVDRKGATPLHAAVNGNFAKGVELLVVRGADLEIKDGNGFTAKELAALLKYPFIEGMLTMAEKMPKAKDDAQEIKQNRELQEADERRKKNLEALDRILQQKPKPDVG